MRLLCVDDDPAIRAMLEVAFSVDPDISATILETGLEVLKAAKAGPWDAFLLDAEMPGLDGYGICRRLKADPATAGVPVVFLTAHTKPVETERALTLGATAWIGKPFDPRTFAADFRAALEQ